DKMNAAQQKMAMVAWSKTDVGQKYESDWYAAPSGPIKADGTFRIEWVSPGRYDLHAIVISSAFSPEPQLVGQAEKDVEITGKSGDTVDLREIPLTAPEKQ